MCHIVCTVFAGLWKKTALGKRSHSKTKSPHNEYPPYLFFMQIKHESTYPESILPLMEQCCYISSHNVAQSTENRWTHAVTFTPTTVQTAAQASIYKTKSKRVNIRSVGDSHSKIKKLAENKKHAHIHSIQITKTAVHLLFVLFIIQCVCVHVSVNLSMQQSSSLFYTFQNLAI